MLRLLLFFGDAPASGCWYLRCVPCELRHSGAGSAAIPIRRSGDPLKVLSDLDALGIELSTDDFGTGYSSLSYLQKFPFERLKIDRSFVQIMDEDEKSGAIVKTILMLGENLNIEVVAEGIETESQLEKLRALGCTLGQGYYFSRPIDVQTVERHLVNGPDMFGFGDQPQFRSADLTIEVPKIQ